tara:strand:+ start:196 stop:321 length:126 start_codon:yes stop_codon:yes gene_type:complete
LIKQYVLLIECKDFFPEGTFEKSIVKKYFEMKQKQYKVVRK